MKKISAIIMVSCALLAQGCMTSPMASGTDSIETADSRDVQEYRLGVSDQLRVLVFGEDNLSGEFVVDSTGTVSMPLIGQVTALGQTTREFQSSVETKLNDGYLRNPQVSVEVLNFRPYYILGEVNTAGEYPYSNGLTVLNAIATAGGFSYRANKKYVFIKRADEATEVRYPLTVTTPVQPGDTVRIGERLF